MRPQLVALGGQATPRPVQHVDRAGPALVGGQAVAIRPDREVGVTVAIEVARGERGPNRSPDFRPPMATPLTPGESWLHSWSPTVGQP